ncbi:MAG: hypothetical protein BIFFINMI_01707 [Phycisphaerae bacterium]|nr:hypothetical protein [Phycisphaerae bacterium]
MTDDEIRNRLSAYLDGQLPEAEAAAVRAYLARHPDAQGNLDRLSRADAAVRASADQAASQLDTERLIAAVGGRLDAQPSPRRRTGWLGWTVGAAAALLAVGLLTVLYRTLPAGPTHRQEAMQAGFAAADAPLPPIVPASQVSAAQLGAISDDVAAPGATIQPMRSAPPPGYVAAPGVRPAPPPVATPQAATALQFPAAATGPAASAQAALAGDDPEAAALPPAGVALAEVPPADPEGVQRALLYDELVRKIEVVMIRASTLGPQRSPRWQSLADTIRSDELVERCRRGRRMLPADSDLARLLASAEVILVRTELAGSWVDEAAAVQEAIAASNILERCRRLRA